MEEIQKTATRSNSGLYLFIATLVVITTAVTYFAILQKKESQNSHINVTPSITNTIPTTIQPTPVYTTTFEDQTFFWATHSITQEQGVFITTSNLRKRMVPPPITQMGVFIPISAVSETTRETYEKVLFTELKNIQKLLIAPSNFPANVGMIIPGYVKNSYIFSIYDDENCVKVQGGTFDQCSEYHYQVSLTDTNLASILLLRTYLFGTTNSARKVNGIETPIAALSNDHIAMHVNPCHWCGGSNKPDIYIVNLKNNTEEYMGAIGNFQKIDGTTYTYQKALQQKYICPVADPTCENGMYPEFEYVLKGDILTGTLK